MLRLKDVWLLCDLHLYASVWKIWYFIFQLGRMLHMLIICTFIFKLCTRFYLQFLLTLLYIRKFLHSTMVLWTRKDARDLQQNKSLLFIKFWYTANAAKRIRCDAHFAQLSALQLIKFFISCTWNHSNLFNFCFIFLHIYIVQQWFDLIMKWFIWIHLQRCKHKKQNIDILQ